MRNFKKYNGITLVALVVTIVILLILSGITINALVGDNGLINMARKAKEKTEEAIKKEQQQLAGIFERNYLDYNGKLSTLEGKLVNQYNEIITLKGFVGSQVSKNSIHYSQNHGWSYYLNQDSINVLKSWGTNVIRMGVQLEEINNTEIMNDFYDTVDLLTENKMYVVVLLWNSGDINKNIENAIQYFSAISEKYQDSPNIIYEIANEVDRNYTWNQIKEYSNTIISTIRNKSKDNIIIIPSPQHDTKPDQVNLSEIKDTSDNIMVAYHMYVGDGMSEDNIKSFLNASNNNIPIFVTEWGTTMSTAGDGFYENYSNAFVRLMKNYNISWCNFHITDRNAQIGTEQAGIVKNEQWNNSLDENILTESGKYVKSILQGNCSSYNSGEYAMLMGRNDDFAFWKEEYRNNIISIEIRKGNIIPNNAIEWWNVADDNLSGDYIYAYIINDEIENKYKLYIESNSVINFPQSASKKGTFKDFKNVKSINFDNINTNNCQYLSSLFMGCNSLESINGIEKINTDNNKAFTNMFDNCTLLKSVDISGWNFSKADNLWGMFGGCKNLSQIEGLENINVSKVQYFNSMFNNCYNIENINLSNWNTSRGISMRYMFAYSKIKNINMKNIDMLNVTDTSEMFMNCNIDNIYLNNIKINLENITNYSNMFKGINDNVSIYVDDENIAKWIYDRISEVSAKANIYYGSTNILYNE